MLHWIQIVYLRKSLSTCKCWDWHVLEHALPYVCDVLWWLWTYCHGLDTFMHRSDVNSDRILLMCHKMCSHLAATIIHTLKCCLMLLQNQDRSLLSFSVWGGRLIYTLWQLEMANVQRDSPAPTWLGLVLYLRVTVALTNWRVIFLWPGLWAPFSQEHTRQASGLHDNGYHAVFNFSV